MEWRVLFLTHVALAVVVYDEECDVSRNCSQEARSQHEHPFPCQIGHKEECDKLSEQYVDPVDRAGIDRDSFPMLYSIGIYERGYTGQRYTSPSFNFSVRLPTNRHILQTTRAIKVDFMSPKGNGADSYYSDNPVCRVFNFSEAKMTEHSLLNPPVIPYTCLVGLELGHNIRYLYQIIIETFPARAKLTYTIVAHKLLKERNMTVAVASVPLRRSIHVVFEPSPTKFNIVSYNILLNNTKTGDTKSVTLTDAYQHEFLDCTPGVYIVKVEPSGVSCPDDDCRGTQSDPIELNFIEPPGLSMSDDLTLKVLCAVVGITAGVLLLLIMCCMYQRCRQRKDLKSKTILLLYTAKFQTEADNLDVLLESLNFEVFKKKFEDIDEERLNEGSSEQGTTSVLFDQKVNKILFLCSKEISRHYQRGNLEIEEQPLQECLTSTIRQVNEDEKLSSKSIIVCFDSTDHKHIQLESASSVSADCLPCLKDWDSIEECIKKKSCYCLPKDFHKLYCYLLQRRKQQHYKKSTEWKNFSSVNVKKFKSKDVPEGTMNNGLLNNSSKIERFQPPRTGGYNNSTKPSYASLSDSEGPDEPIPMEDEESDRKSDTTSLSSANEDVSVIIFENETTSESDHTRPKEPVQPLNDGTRYKGPFQPQSDHTRSKEPFQPQSDHTRSKESFQPQSDHTRSKEPFQPQSDHTRSKEPFQPQSDHTRSKEPFQPQSDHTRSKGPFQPQSDHTRSKEPFQPQSDHTRSKGPFQPQSDHTRSKEPFQPQSDHTRSKGPFQPLSDHTRSKGPFQPQSDHTRSKEPFQPQNDHTRSKGPFQPQNDHTRSKGPFQPQNDHTRSKGPFQPQNDHTRSKGPFQPQNDHTRSKGPFQPQNDHTRSKGPFQPQNDHTRSKGPFQPQHDHTRSKGPVQPQNDHTRSKGPVQPQNDHTRSKGPFQPQNDHTRSKGPVQPQNDHTRSKGPFQPQNDHTRSKGPVQPQNDHTRSKGPFQPQNDHTKSKGPFQPQNDHTSFKGPVQPQNDHTRSKRPVQPLSDHTRSKESFPLLSDQTRPKELYSHSVYCNGGDDQEFDEQEILVINDSYGMHIVKPSHIQAQVSYLHPNQYNPYQHHFDCEMMHCHQHGRQPTNRQSGREGDTEPQSEMIHCHQQNRRQSHHLQAIQQQTVPDYLQHRYCH